METLSELMVLCWDSSPKGSIMRRFHLFFAVRLRNGKQTVELSLKWDAMALTWRHCNIYKRKDTFESQCYCNDSPKLTLINSHESLHNISNVIENFSVQRSWFLPGIGKINKLLKYGISEFIISPRCYGTHDNIKTPVPWIILLTLVPAVLYIVSPSSGPP